MRQTVVKKIRRGQAETFRRLLHHTYGAFSRAYRVAPLHRRLWWAWRGVLPAPRWGKQGGA